MEPPPGISQWPHSVMDNSTTMARRNGAATSDSTATESNSGAPWSAAVSDNAFQFEDAEEEETYNYFGFEDSDAMSRALIGKLVCSHLGVPTYPETCNNNADEPPDVNPTGLSLSVSQDFDSAITDSPSAVGQLGDENATILPRAQIKETSALGVFNRDVTDIHSRDSSKSNVTSSFVTTPMHQILAAQPRFTQRRRPQPQTTEIELRPLNRNPEHATTSVAAQTLNERQSKSKDKGQSMRLHTWHQLGEATKDELATRVIGKSRRGTTAATSVETKDSVKQATPVAHVEGGPLNDIAMIKAAYDIKDLTTHDILCGPNSGIFPTAG